MIATEMSEREECRGGGGMRFGRGKAGCYTHTRTHVHTHTHMHTQSLPSIISQDTGEA